MSKFKLASFGCFPYKQVPYIPTFVFNSDSIFFVQKFVSQWVYPHLLAMAYFKAFNVKRNINVSIDELYANQNVNILETEYHQNIDQETPPSHMLDIIKRMFEIQQPRGSFGAYTVSSLMCSMALSHF